MLGELSVRQEEYREMVHELVDSESEDDKSYRHELESKTMSGFSDIQVEPIIAIATVKLEMDKRDETHTDDILWAGEFIDHLDTLGWRLERK